MSETLATAKETAVFEPHHLFYSRTNAQSVIISANTVFQLVSGYDWDEIVGRPHKIVRHPSMPRAVFKLLWDKIQSGHPMGVYIVNKTKSGEAYTVFAVTMPFEDGFVSVRIKPMSGRAAQVKKLYDEIAARETAEALEPEQSAELLLAGIKALGFDDYDGFISDALEAETNERIKTLGALQPREVAALSSIHKAVETIADAGRQLNKLLAETNQIPDNMRLQAMRLEGRDGPVGVISANYQVMTETFSQSLKDFLRAAEEAVAPVRDAKFLATTAILVREASRLLRTETGMKQDKKEIDLEALERLLTQYEGMTEQAVKDVARRADYFERISKDMRRMVFGLEMTRTMCNIERSKSSSNTDALDGVVERLQAAEAQLSDLMSDVEGAVHDILSGANGLLRNREAKPAAEAAPIAAE